MDRQPLGPLQERWLAALESGEYRQGTNRLRRVVDGQELFCCLGVACAVFPEGHPKKARANEHIADDSYAGLFFDVASAMGLRGVFGELAAPVRKGDVIAAETLADLNDGQMWTFKNIAAFIREDPARVFTEPK